MMDKLDKWLDADMKVKSDNAALLRAAWAKQDECAHDWTAETYYTDRCKKCNKVESIFTPAHFTEADVKAAIDAM